VPSLTEEEIKARIAAGDVVGISVDTTIFDRYQCNLRYASLRKLDQFQAGPVRFYLSDVVSQEVLAHIQRDAAQSQRDLDKAIKAHQRRWALAEEDVAAPASFELQADPAQAARQQVDEFVAATAAEMVVSTQPDTIAPEVIRRYFAAEPPFETGGKKKHEFPDAFALLSLEARAAAAGRFYLCVSTDSGWKAFSDASDHLICMEDLELALSLFNEAGVIVAQQSVGLLRAGSAAMLEAIDNALEYRLDDTDFEVEANSPLYFDAEPTGAIVQDIESASATDPIVIAADDDSVTFTTTLRATVGFEASFSYSVRDWIDKDYVKLGSESEYVEDEVEFEVALTVSRPAEGEPEVLEAQVAKQRFTVDFGHVEPFRNEDPTSEKY
jgi:predicted nucleic acid-binding protein